MSGRKVADLESGDVKGLWFAGLRNVTPRVDIGDDGDGVQNQRRASDCC